MLGYPSFHLIKSGDYLVLLSASISSSSRAWDDRRDVFIQSMESDPLVSASCPVSLSKWLEKAKRQTMIKPNHAAKAAKATKAIGSRRQVGLPSGDDRDLENLAESPDASIS